MNRPTSLLVWCLPFRVFLGGFGAVAMCTVTTLGHSIRAVLLWIAAVAVISIPGIGLLLLGLLVLGLLLSIQALQQLPLLPRPQASKEALRNICLRDRNTLPCRACK